MELRIYTIDNKEIHTVLSQLTNLRSLYLSGIELELDFKIIFTHLKYLRYLHLTFNNNQVSIENLNKFVSVYNDS